MKKNSGFMLMETLIVSTFVAVVLIFLFVQLRNVSSSYERSFTYNSSQALYSASKIRSYLYTRNTDLIKEELESTTKGYIDVTSCTYNFYTLEGENANANEEYCKALYDSLDVKKILVSLQDLSVVKNRVIDNMLKDDISQKFVDFINYVKYTNNKDQLRLLVEFEDDTYASIVMEMN